MIFNTWVFAVFATVFLILFWSLIPAKHRPMALIVGGCLFYAWATPAYLLLIGALSGVTYTTGRAMIASRSSGRRRALLFFGGACSLGTLIAFKYFHLLAATVDQIAGRHVVPLPTLLIPLAISFFTFEFVHVLVDIDRLKIDRLSARDFAVFTLFFPTLVAGPIKRFQTFAPQIGELRTPSRETFALNAYRVVLGLTKKVVLADSLDVLTRPITAPGPPYHLLDYWVAVAAFTGKIYFDFSGYSDMAIGTSGMLGFRIPENFNRPYRSQNIQIFWRRWHISLSDWIRDYVFVPLGGSRRPGPVVAANLLAAMGLAGLWHGAAWNFVLWGLWHGAGLVIHRLWSLSVVTRVAELKRPSLAVVLASTTTTFLFVALGWILFAATSLSNAVRVYRLLLSP